MQFNIPAEHRKASGVYIIRNSVNDKVYVGSAQNFKTRFYNHSRTLRLAQHHAIGLQRFVDKYGLKELSFELLELAEPDNLVQCEQKWMDYYCCCEYAKGFNTLPAAGSPRGYKHSAETRAKLVAAHKNRGPVSAETRAKQSAVHKGKIVSAETRAKKSASGKGRICTPETRAKISAANRGKQRSAEVKAAMAIAGVRPENLERLAKMTEIVKNSDDVKAKMASSAKAYWATEGGVARKAKISAFHKGCKRQPVSLETKAKMSAAAKGRTVSQETKAKMSAAAKARCSKVNLAKTEASQLSIF